MHVAELPALSRAPYIEVELVSGTASNVVELPLTGATVIPDGVYQLAFERYQLSTQFGRGSLELWFKVLDYGPHFQFPVARFYKVQREGKRGFRASLHSAFNREFAAVFGHRPPNGLAAVNSYRDCYLEGRIRTVVTDHRQRELPLSARYSVVEELTKRLDR